MPNNVSITEISSRSQLESRLVEHLIVMLKSNSNNDKILTLLKLVTMIQAIQHNV